MEITEIRVKLVNVKNDKLRAFCSITVDNDFVIRDLKVIEGAKGAFVAMPSRKLTDRCPRCGGKNHYRARFCNDCGARLSGDRSAKYDRGNQKLHTDIAHPINSKCREVIQKKVLEVYQEEMQKSTAPDYKPMEFEVFDEEALVEESSSELGLEPGLQEHVEPSQGEMEPSRGREEAKVGPEGNVSTGRPSRAGAEPQAPEHGRAGGSRPQGGRERGRDNDRRSERSEHGRGRFQREGRRGEERDQGRGDRRRGNGQGQGAGRGDDQRPRAGQNRVGGSEGAGLPDRDRETFLPSQPTAAAAGPSSSQSQPPPVNRPREEPEPEPEDNFGAGLFS